MFFSPAHFRVLGAFPRGRESRPRRPLSSARPARVCVRERVEREKERARESENESERERERESFSFAKKKSPPPQPRLFGESLWLRARRRRPARAPALPRVSICNRLVSLTSLFGFVTFREKSSSARCAVSRYPQKTPSIVSQIGERLWKRDLG